MIGVYSPSVNPIRPAFEPGSFADSPAQAARIMPSQMQRAGLMTEIDQMDRQLPDYQRRPTPVIHHPRLAPSAISSEQFLLARQAFGPGYAHNVQQTNIARISDMYQDMPRFRNQVDLLA